MGLLIRLFISAFRGEKEVLNMERRKPVLREVLAFTVFVTVIGVLFVLNFVIPAPTVLVSERRPPATLPELSLKSVLSGDFMSKFDNYAADRFVFRDVFRGVRSFMVYDIYMQTDKAGLYRTNSVGVGEFKRIDEKSFRQSSERLKKAADSLDGLDMNIYYSIVPDKSVFSGRYMPGFDLATAEGILFDVFGDYKYIPLMNKLDAECFYKTDIHWDQSKISGVVSHILSSMGASADLGGFSIVNAGEFRGVYSGQLALPIAADEMNYLDMPGLSVTYLNEKTLKLESGPVYDTQRFAGIDPYDLFLRGSQPLIVIENSSAPERELFLFRDSYGSSLAPLLAGSYSKVTVIDLRYIHMGLLDQFIDLTPGSDVLFIYSSQIFNNPSILMV